MYSLYSALLFAGTTGGGADFLSAAVADVVADAVVDVASLESRATTSKTDVSSKATKRLLKLNISECIRYFAASTRFVASQTF